MRSDVDVESLAGSTDVALEHLRPVQMSLVPDTVASVRSLHLTIYSSWYSWPRLRQGMGFAKGFFVIKMNVVARTRVRLFENDFHFTRRMGSILILVAL